MDLEQIPDGLKAQARVYALQCVVAALCVRILAQEDKPEQVAKAIMDDALGSIAKFDLRGPAPDEIKAALRAMMETLATETISAAAQTVRQRDHR